MKYGKSLSRSIIAILILVITMVNSCGPARQVRLQITQPADITFPADVNSMVLVDRTKPAQQGWNIVEGIFTGEMPGEDRMAARESINALYNELGRSPRFRTRLYAERLTGNSISNDFPPLLDWGLVEKICRDEQSEVMVCLEYFDTDFVVTNGSRIKKKSEGSGNTKREIEYTEYYAQGLGKVKMGIRVYHPKSRTIADQQVFRNTKTWEAVGRSVADAAALLIGKTEANRQLAAMAAADYAYKISPMPIWINRSMYGKARKAPAVKEGRRFADVGQWQKAIEVWKNSLPSAEPKDAGKLAYNIAVGYEVSSDYGQALQWAQDAYTRYGNKAARDYVRLIEQRIQDENLLKQQMER